MFSCPTQCGDTALIYAAFHGRTDCVRVLAEAGADKEAKNNVRLHVTLCVLRR